MSGSLLHAALRLKLYLGQDDGKEHEAGTAEFPAAHLLVQDDPAEDCAEYALKAHDKACNCRVDTVLPDDLKRIGNTAGEDPGVQDGRKGEEKGLRSRVLGQEHQNGAEDGDDEKLHPGEPERVQQWAEMVQYKNLYGKQKGAGEDPGVADLQTDTAGFHAF